MISLYLPDLQSREMLGSGEVLFSNLWFRAGFLDLTSLAILAGYKFHSKNMTAMGLQVHGTLLNKPVSTGDNLWEVRWKDIPELLRDVFWTSLNWFLEFVVLSLEGVEYHQVLEVGAKTRIEMVESL